VFALAAQVRGGWYAWQRASQAPPVRDLVLDSLPTVNADAVIVQGAILFLLICIALFLWHPRHLFFGVKAVALFVMVRATFLNLTTFGVHPSQAVFDDGFGSALYNLVNFDGNFFFSGHTGMPFLMALIFWNIKQLRVLFLAIAVLFAASVLLAHVHYSIDVFAAPFITYGIFRIAQWLFSSDYALCADFSKSDIA
jgi:hypothetical protein